MCFDAFKSGVVSKRLLNETTWNIKRRRKRTDNTKKRFLENQSHSAENLLDQRLPQEWLAGFEPSLIEEVEPEKNAEDPNR